MLRCTLIIFIIFLTHQAFSQSHEKIQTVQPKVMVIPFTRENEDIRTVLEDDFNRRVAISKVKEHFDQRGFSTVDFIQKVKISRESGIINSGNQNDIKSAIIQSSGADIFVTADMKYNQSTGGNSVIVLLQAYESSTGNSLANRECNSGRFFTDDISRLTSKAVESGMEEFLNTMQMKFTDILNNGRSILIDITISNESKYKFTSEFNELPLSDLLEEWFSKNSYKNNYHIQGTSDLRMILDDVRIPIKDPDNQLNYNPNKFALVLFKYFKELGLEVNRTIKGSTLYFTIK